MSSAKFRSFISSPLVVTFQDLNIMILQSDRPFHTRADVQPTLLGNALRHNRKDNKARGEKKTKHADFYHFITKENVEQKTPGKKQFKETEYVYLRQREEKTYQLPGMKS